MGLLHHWRWNRRLQEWDDGEAAPELALLVELHVAICPECHDEVVAIRALKGALMRMGS
ncbi:MAG: zf-HC2 domain-containing protein [Acidimicrobiales bacterium]